MKEIEQILKMNWYNHPAIKQSWLAEKLYGTRTTVSRSKLAQKITGAQGKRFSVDELKQLEEIRQELINDLGK